MYTVNKIKNDIYNIVDEHGDICYVIIGSIRALVIDLGQSINSMTPIIQQITSLPFDVVVTHGHGDHIGRSGEFAIVHMSLLDLDVFHWNKEVFDRLDLCDDDCIKDIQDGDIFDLGNHHVMALSLAGHTPGSMIFVDIEGKSVFTGDAIGSGCGVWMQLPHSLSLVLYQRALKRCVTKLENLGVDENWQFFGGHDKQEYYSKVSNYNPLNFQLVKDMIMLCQKLLEGQMIGTISNATSFTSQALYASYGKAEIVYCQEKLKK